jgi:beta-lactamase regulating signal transducer with metallopeptidase domain
VHSDLQSLPAYYVCFVTGARGLAITSCAVFVLLQVHRDLQSLPAYYVCFVTVAQGLAITSCLLYLFCYSCTGVCNHFLLTMFVLLQVHRDLQSLPAYYVCFVTVTQGLAITSCLLCLSCYRCTGVCNHFLLTMFVLLQVHRDLQSLPAYYVCLVTGAQGLSNHRVLRSHPIVGLLTGEFQRCFSVEI